MSSWIELRKLSIQNNIDLNMTVYEDNIKNKDIDKDYVYLEKIDEIKKINVINEIDLINKEKGESIEQYICIDYNYYINDVLNSFKSEDDIKKQFMLDIPRCKVYINNHIIDSPEILVDYLNLNFTKKITLKVMMLTTQAFLGLPFSIIFDQLQDISTYYLSEIENSEIENSKRCYRICLTIKNDKINFNTYKEFRIFKMEDDIDKTLYRVCIKISFELNNENLVLLNVKTIRI